MKTKLFTIAFLLSFVMNAFSQLDKPTFSIGIGISEPFDQLKGGKYYINTIYQQNNITAPVTLIDTNLFKSHYGANTGFNIFGSAKINFDKYNILRGSAFIGYTSFNAFEGSISGNQIDRYYYQNQYSYTTIPISYNYNFNVFSFGFGLDIAPTSFTNVLSPYFGANIVFNSLNASLDRTKNNRDTVGFSANAFRIGVNFDAGIEARLGKNFGLSLGIKYDLGNLLLKNSVSGNLAEIYEWGSKNAAINDEEGLYFTKLPNYLYDGTAYGYNGQKKNVNWGTIYIAINFYPDFKTKKDKK